MIKISYWSFLILIILNSSCALPLAMLGFVQEGEREEKEEFSFEDEFDETRDYKNYISVYIENEKGEEQYALFAGEYNRVRIDLPVGVKPEDVELTTTAGKIQRTEEDATLFSIFVEEANIAVEITAKEKNGKAFGYLMTETVYFPTPTPYLPAEDNGQISIEDFKKQGQLILDQNEDYAILCKCTGFRITRIAKDGSREMVDNGGDAFSQETKILTAKASSGDIYIFENIMVNCPGYVKDKQSRNLVYILK